METFGKGCIPSKYDIRDYKIKPNVSMAVNFPDNYCLDKKVEVKNQGQVGSCVAHATAEILEYHENVKLSTDFIYGIHNKLYKSRGPGMMLCEALKIVHDYGDPAYEYCATNTEVDATYAIAEKVFANKTAMDDALLHRAARYARLFTINDIKYALMNYGPVLVAINWYDDNRCVNGVLLKGTFNPGGHAVIVLGWNETGFICQNSWGTRWGDHGYFVIPYNYRFSEAFSLVPDGNIDDIEIPKRNTTLDLIYRIINTVVNLFLDITGY